MLDVVLGRRPRARVRREEHVVLEPLDRTDFEGPAERGELVRRRRDDGFLFPLGGELDDRGGGGSDGELFSLDGPASRGRTEAGGESRVNARSLEVVDSERGGGREDREERRVGCRIRAEVDECSPRYRRR